MKVKCLDDSGGGVEYVKQGEIYIVYAMFVGDGELSYLLSNPKEVRDLPRDHSADMFEVLDSLLPPFWYFNLVGEEQSVERRDSLRIIWGYKEMALDPNHYVDLVEREPEALAIFARRKEEIDEYEELRISK